MEDIYINRYRLRQAETKRVKAIDIYKDRRIDGTLDRYIEIDRRMNMQQINFIDTEIHAKQHVSK